MERAARGKPHKTPTAPPRIVVLGGGAAGLVAAIAAAEALDGRGEVVLAERNPRVGKKLLATGNGRCNLDNTNAAPAHYFTSDPQMLEKMLAAIAQTPPLDWLRAHGLHCRVMEDGRVYPYSNQAADVLNLLLLWLERTGVQVRSGVQAQQIEQSGSGYAVRLSDGSRLKAAAVIAALGGSAGPQFGTDGFGPQLAALCGCKMARLYPCLTPLRCQKQQVAGLAGVRVSGRVSLCADGACLHSEKGEVQFTEYGLSGIAVMQLSGRLAQTAGCAAHIEVDLFPALDEDGLTAFLQQRAAALPGASVAQSMTGLLHKRVAALCWRQAGLGSDALPVDSLHEAQWRQLAHAFLHWRFDELEPLGWQQAQTTGGGLRLSQLEPQSFMLRGLPGLYFVGETLDCAGECGGFNLHWAFGSGLLAGRHAAAQLTKGSRR